MVAALKALDALCAQYDGREALVLAGNFSISAQHYPYLQYLLPLLDQLESYFLSLS